MAGTSRFPNFRHMDAKSYEQQFARHDALYRNVIAGFARNQVILLLPNAWEVLSDLVYRMDAIYQGMVDLGGWGNLYGVFILFRSLIDHYVLAQYLVDKTKKENCDAVAEQYKKHLFISEVLQEQLKLMKMADLLGRVETEPDFLTFLHDKFPEMKEFDRENQKELSAAIR
jgi:hypothetical protein